MKLLELYEALKALAPEYVFNLTESVQDGWHHWGVMVYDTIPCDCCKQAKNEIVCSSHIAKSPQELLDDIASQLRKKANN